MKLTDIERKYGIASRDFERFLIKCRLDYKEGLLGLSIDDSKEDEYVKQYKEYVEKTAEEAKEKAEEEARRREEEAKQMQAANAEMQAALPNILITSGFNFDGYKVVKYSGYISGDDATQIPRGGIFGSNNGENLTKALVKIRRQALIELKEAAYNLGCNAVIGVDFDYITLEPESVNITGGTRYEPYVICVTANGNAVVIEKEN